MRRCRKLSFPMKVIRGRKALVTGAASGIGRAIALALAREGADLYMVDIDREKLQSTARDAEHLGIVAIADVCDLSEPEQVSAMVTRMLAAWQGVDILINNAGIAYYGPTHNMMAGQWQRMLSVNLSAPIQLVRELTPVLVTREEAYILNVCSVFGLVTQRKVTAYQTTKFAMVGFTLALRAEYAGRGFGVTALCPGLVRTPMLEAAEKGRPDKRLPLPPAWLMTTPEHVAAAAIAAIRRNRGLVIVSPFARLMWWAWRLAPGLIDWISREGWRGRGKVDVAADIKARDDWLAERRVRDDTGARERRVPDRMTSR
jgi:3-oxoacyl-[acyl-carrier protein] reductase